MAVMTTNYRSRPMNHSMMMMLMLSAQTPSPSLKMGHSQTIPAPPTDDRLFIPPPTPPALPLPAEIIVQNQPAPPNDPANENPSSNQPAAQPDKPPPGFTHVSQTFDRYVQPPEGLYWNTAVCEASHGLTPNSP